MFKYLKQKVPSDVYDEMKSVLIEELNPNNTNKKDDSLASAHEVINLVSKNNSRNNKKRADEKILFGIKSNYLI